jgi:RES domain-containing protein
MFIYRITWSKYAKDLKGEGSRLFGSRWNHKGTYCLYAAESRALSMLEYAVNTRLNDIPEDLSVITYSIPGEVHKLSVPDLPENWNSPKVSNSTRDIGTNLLRERKHLIIQVPSVIIPEEFNFLINPLHYDMKKVAIANISKFSFDVRLKQ